MDAARKILKEFWGFDQFRPGQEEIIKTIVEGHDVLALMPTGGGKSICYQVPVMMKPGLGLIISPLIALMKDQVEGLRRKGITAFAIYSGMTRKELIQTLKIACDSNCKFLFVSPERLETKIFQEYLPGLNINLLAVDEAHCISQWGYDFRPPYLRIASIREYLNDVPVLALTASATREVQEDICLHLTPKSSPKAKVNWKIFRQSFERPNLSYSVFQSESRINKIIEILQKVNGPSIIYCRSRKRTKEIAELIGLHQISSSYYHAGLTADERTKRQEGWLNNKIRVIVCTNAFGMGIDKPDVRTVIHADVPDCLENYYQEAGRAGRDRKRSYAVLLVEGKDITALENLSSTKFPSLENIRTVYQSVSNYLQIPTGIGEGEYFDFDISDFLKKFKLPATLVVNSLKVLEQEGWLSFNEQVFIPPLAGFTCSKETLYNYEKEHPLHEPLIKTLLRSYEGIFDQPVAISEKLLAGILKTTPEEIINLLHELAGRHLIEYNPIKDKPQIFFQKQRIKTEDLSIEPENYRKRKEVFDKRIRVMIGFVNNDQLCRSRIIGNYFGDEKLNDCGICDNCISKKKKTIDKTEFENIRKRVITALNTESRHVDELTSPLNQSEKTKFMHVIEFMQNENEIKVDYNGRISLRK